MRNLKPREQPGGVRRRQLARGRAEIPAGVSGWGSGRLVGGEALQELGAPPGWAGEKAPRATPLRRTAGGHATRTRMPGCLARTNPQPSVYSCSDSEARPQAPLTSPAPGSRVSLPSLLLAFPALL